MSVTFVHFPQIVSKTSSFFRVSTDSDGIEDDDLEVDLLISKHIPEVLPIKGQRIKIYYPGINVLCLKCYKAGHYKWDCPSQYKTNWLEFVYKFYKSDKVSDEMLGSWVDTLNQYHPEFQQEKPLWSKQHKDLRKNLNDKKKLEKKALVQKEPKQPNTHVQVVRGRGRGKSKNSPTPQPKSCPVTASRTNDSSAILAISISIPTS